MAWPRLNSMPSPGAKPAAGYGLFVLRFVRGYLFLLAAVLLALLAADALFPQARLYGRIKAALRDAIVQSQGRP